MAALWHYRPKLRNRRSSRAILNTASLRQCPATHIVNRTTRDDAKKEIPSTGQWHCGQVADVRIAGSQGRQVEFRSLDGLRLRGTLVLPSTVHGPAVVLVHGGGVTREEGGFYARLAAALAEAGLASLRFDFRAHGESEGRGEDLTISAVANDIRAAVSYVRDVTGSGLVDLIGASFGGGISAFFTARHPGQIRRLVLFNPLLDYKKRFIDDKPDWDSDQISEQAGQELAAQGFLTHSPTFRLGRALLNEVFFLSPRQALTEVTVPVLLVHGTRDTFVPIESSREAARQITRTQAPLIEIDGAQHGFAVHDDPQYREPQTQQWQAFVIRSVIGWLTEPG
jgi:pimeloyl-ACP methyl ester carboxylesterase